MKKEILIGLAVALLVAGLLSPFASSSPDGLERVAEDKGFIHKGEGKTVIKSPIPDYAIPGLTNKTAAGSLAGLVGTGITFAAAYGLAKVIARRNKARLEK